ncbi:Zinc finger MYND-type [Trinorchestia longiramus]|nr:Zinc finger MYND-type [Trinorchestia longiramus]
MRDYWSYVPREQRNKKISLKKGDTILTSEPFAYIVDNDRRGEYCEACLVSNRKTSLFPCKKCGFNFYCSEACAQESWDTLHKRECPKLKNYRCGKGDLIPNFARLLARIIFRLQDGGENIEEKYLNNRGRKFKDLMNHYKDIKNDSVRMRDVRNMMRILDEYIGSQNVPNECDFIGVYGRSSQILTQALVNRFCLNDEVNVPMGSAVFLAASIFDHACIPNAHPSFVGKKLYIRTLVDIPELNLDKVFISYIDCVNSKEMRRLELHRNWYFWCECDLCHDQERELYENFINCENPMCEQMVKVPDRYSKPECTQPPKQEDDDMTALQKALQATKLEFKLASIPVNPFASQDACLSYIFYDKNRYQLASDSECSEVTDDESPEPPAESGMPEVAYDKPETSSPSLTNGSGGGSISTNGELEKTTSIELNGVDDRESDDVPDERTDAILAPRNKSLRKKSLTNGSFEEKDTGEEAEENNTANGAKPKIVKKKNKALLTKKKQRNSDEATHKLLNADDKNSKMETGDSGEQLVTSNDVGKSESLLLMTNGHASSEDFPSHPENKTQVVDGSQHETMALHAVQKKKKLRRKAPVFEKSDVLCEGCQCYVDRNTLREYRSTVSFTIQRLKDMKEDNPSFQIVQDVLERQGTLLPKLNVWRVRALDFAFNSSFYSGAWMLALKYGMENLEGMKFFYRPGHPTLGLFLMKLSKVHMNLKEYRRGLQFVQEAQNILTVGMGPKHPFITGELYKLEMMANEDLEIYLEKRIANQSKQVTEIVCPCCGKKKVIRHYGSERANEEKPWEKDIKIKQLMNEESQFLGDNDFTKY